MKEDEKIKVLILGATGEIGSIVKSSISNNNVQVYSPSSKVLNISNIESIAKYIFDKKLNSDSDILFDYVFYCVLDKSNKDEFENRNLQNLRNLLCYIDCFKKVITISSRAVYDGFISYQKIETIDIEKIPLPINNPYSILKYKEEKVLKSIADKCIILRLFDLTRYEDFNDIKKRWLNQISHKGYCKNEILSPIKIDILEKIINEIIDEKISCGTYNICGEKTISSIKSLMSENLVSLVSKNKEEKTGRMSLKQYLS